MICRRAAALFDAGQECGADANMAKLLASEATWHAAEATFSAYGGFAFAKEYDIERKWREARLYQTALDQPHPRLSRSARPRHAALLLSVDNS